MARIAANLLSYPPARYIGSELMTRRLLMALLLRGHEVTAYCEDAGDGWTHDGVVVKDVSAMLRARRSGPAPDLFVCHVDHAINMRIWRRQTGVPIVGIAHNLEQSVLNGLASTPFSLVVANAQWAYDALQQRSDAPVVLVRPPLQVTPREHPLDGGDRVTIINFNENKGGQVAWQLADRLPMVKFLFVRGGYGRQIERRRPPANVEVIDHVPQDQLEPRVWSRTRALIVPSKRETWGSTASEALAHGVPVVASPTPGLIENLGDAAIYADRDDLTQWLAALAELRDDKKHRRRALASLRRARLLAAQTDTDLADWCDAVDTILGGTRDAARAG